MVSAHPVEGELTPPRTAPFYLHSEIWSCPIHGEHQFTRCLSADGHLLGSVGQWTPCPCYYQIEKLVEQEFSQTAAYVIKTLDKGQLDLL